MSKANEHLLEALDFLAGRADAMASVAPAGKGPEWAAAALWYPMEPAYSWRRLFGDFSPATLAAGIRRGLVEEPRKHAYRITQAGRDYLASTKEPA